MKYLLWEIYNNSIFDGSEAEKAWHEALEKNEVLYQEARKKLPKKFVEIFEQEDRFHDMGLANYRMYTKKKVKRHILNLDMDLQFYNDHGGDYRLYFKGVLDYKFNTKEHFMEMWTRIPGDTSMGAWMYSEIFHEDKIIVFNIMLAGGTEINIKCRKIDIEELKI